MIDNLVDINENTIKDKSSELMAILLTDRTTGRNIIWATDDYAERGAGYRWHDEITAACITSYQNRVIRPRAGKSADEQRRRCRDKAEVFTPSWVCNKQNNLVDNAWFGRKNVFNTENGRQWRTVKKKIAFPSGKTWEEYVCENRLELTCGEAPYLVSRYDTTTGEPIPVLQRIGLLDRKLRIVGENTECEADWVCWAKKAVQSTYAFEWQGDNVLLARENILFSFKDYYEARFGTVPTALLLQIAEILSWNIWQMDGMLFSVPGSDYDAKNAETSFLDNGDRFACLIMDWKENRILRAAELLTE